MALSRRVKLSASQRGIAHLGLILLVVSVFGLVGITSYAVSRKQRSTSNAGDSASTVNPQQLTDREALEKLERDDSIDAARCDQLGRIYSTAENACIRACITTPVNTGTIVEGLVTKQAYCDKAVATDVDKATCDSLHRVWLDDGCARVASGIDTEQSRQCASGYTFYDVKEKATSSIGDTCYTDKAAASAGGATVSTYTTAPEPVTLVDETLSVGGGLSPALRGGSGIVDDGSGGSDGSESPAESELGDGGSTDPGGELPVESEPGDGGSSDPTPTDPSPVDGGGDGGDSGGGDDGGGSDGGGGGGNDGGGDDDDNGGGGGGSGDKDANYWKKFCGDLNRKPDGTKGCKKECSKSGYLVWEIPGSKAYDRCEKKEKCNSAFFKVSGSICKVGTCKSSSYIPADSKKPTTKCKLKNSGGGSSTCQPSKNQFSSTCTKGKSYGLAKSVTAVTIKSGSWNVCRSIPVLPDVCKKLKSGGTNLCAAQNWDKYYCPAGHSTYVKLASGGVAPETEKDRCKKAGGNWDDPAIGASSCNFYATASDRTKGKRSDSLCKKHGGTVDSRHRCNFPAGSKPTNPDGSRDGVPNSGGSGGGNTAPTKAWKDYCKKIGRSIDSKTGKCGNKCEKSGHVFNFSGNKWDTKSPDKSRWHPCYKSTLLSCPKYKAARKAGDTAKCAYPAPKTQANVKKGQLTCNGVFPAKKSTDGTTKKGADKNGKPIYTETACKRGGR